jgi:hypothetical protein
VLIIAIFPVLTMEETPFQAVTRLEEKLEKNRKQRQKLKHELGKF